MEEETCLACMEPSRPGDALHNPCKTCRGLRMHDGCLQKWLSRRPTCPLCRTLLIDEVCLEPEEVRAPLPIPVPPLGVPLEEAFAPLTPMQRAAAAAAAARELAQALNVAHVDRVVRARRIRRRRFDALRRARAGAVKRAVRIGFVVMLFALLACALVPPPRPAACAGPPGAMVCPPMAL